MEQEEKHPVAAGLVALVAVGLSVGLLLGLVTLGFTRVTGLGGSDGSSNAVEGGGPSLYVPTPKPTQRPSGPLLTLAPGQVQGEIVEPAEPPPTSAAASDEITLQVGQTEVEPMDRIDLTGVYPAGEGAILQVQRLEDGEWTDFPVTADVADGQFSTYVRTGRSGEQRFRMRDTDSDKVSNEVTVTVR